jgi:RNA polymerase sigma factor (TIGR02999 family)
MPPVPTGRPGNVTLLLHRLKEGHAEAAESLVTLVYAELHRMAAARMRGERRSHTLQPTALVNEAYMRLVDQTRVDWNDRAHFYAVAARTMRRVLVDYARERLTGKRGGGQEELNIDWIEIEATPEKVDEMLVIDEVLTRLQEFDPQQASIIEMRYFGGMSVKETAAALRISARTVDRDWALAKAWLARELSRGTAS